MKTHIEKAAVIGFH